MTKKVKNIRPPKLNVERDGIVFPPVPRLANYAEAATVFIIACCDVVLIDRKNKLIFLSTRRSKPASGWWWYIGGRRDPGKTARQAIQSIFQRETGLSVKEKRFKFLTSLEYIWADRQQQPQDIPCHATAEVFTLELGDRQRARLKLNADEYQSGLKAFGAENIGETGKYTQEMYRKIFPK